MADQAKPWADVAASPAYQALPPNQREAARSQYFDSVVAPNVPDDQRAAARTQFDRDTAASIGDRAAPALRTVQQIEEQYRQNNRRYLGYADDVDYDTGGSWVAKVAVQKASNRDEARLALEKLYGQGNVGQDQGGRWYAVVNGKKVAIFGGGGGVKTGLSRAASEAEASAPETGGMIVGGLIGSTFAPVLGTAIGAGVGAGTGKGLDEFSKWLQGIHSKTAGQTAGEIGKSAAAGTAIEAGGRIAGKAGGAILDLARRKVLGVTPESQAVTQSFFDPVTGKPLAIPPVKTYGPGMTALQYDQWLRNAVKGDPQQARNVAFAMDRLMTLLRVANVPDTEIEEVFQSIIDPRRAVSTKAEGQIVSGAVKEHIDALTREAETSLQSARAIVEQQGKALESIGKAAPADEAQRLFVERGISARRSFSAAMQRVYDDVDAASGGMEIIPTAPIKAIVAPILETLPKTGQPTIFSEIADLPDYIRIKDAQRFRTRLYEQADSGNLTPGAIHHDYNESAKAFDEVLAPQNMTGVPQAISLLKAADEQYAAGIAKFRDAKLNQMINDYRAQKRLDPEAFAESLFDTDSTFRVSNYRQILGGDWPAVQAADTRMMLRDAKRLSQKGADATVIDGKALWSVLDSRGKMLDAIYGKDIANEWRSYAQRLAAIDGKASVEALPPDQFSLRLMRGLQAQTEAEAFVRNDVLKALRDGGPKEIDAAIKLLSRPGHEAELEHVFTFFENKPEVAQAVRVAVLKQGLSSAMTRTETGIGTRIKGEAIDDFLSQYTKREQELLFPNGLASDLRIVADQMKALFPREGEDFGGSLAAANIKAHIPPLPPTRKRVAASYKWLEVAFTGWLAERPALIRTVADISRVPGGTDISRNALRVLYRQFAMSAAQSSAAQRPTGAPAGAP